MKHATLALFLLSFASAVAAADSEEAEKPLPIVLGGFVDTYYAYDFNEPQNHNRLYSSSALATQPARHNEFNVNLAYLEAKLSAERVRGRVALQAGTSVQANYAGEPTLGLIQEAVVGYKVSDRLWIDGGIYFSHIGFESWISKDNWTYTRSLMAEFSPYYQSGAKATLQLSDAWTAQLHVLNGWQNISENNHAKALGAQLAFSPNGRSSFTYNNFFGNEVGTLYRFFNEWIAQFSITPERQVAAAFDLGTQRNSSDTSNNFWEALAVFARYQVTPVFSVTLRAEAYLDKNQVIVTTGTPNGFQTTSASINADIAPHRQILWRTELRGFWSSDGVFPPKGVSTDGLLVTSLSLKI